METVVSYNYYSYSKNMPWIFKTDIRLEHYVHMLSELPKCKNNALNLRCASTQTIFNMYLINDRFISIHSTSYLKFKRAT